MDTTSVPKRATPETSRFLAACRRRDTAPMGGTPVWFMRQAGRYMSEYRALRARHSMLEVCRTPELAFEVTMQPLKRFDLDAAILFSDILMPLEPMGIPFDFLAGEGPVIMRPVRSAADVAALRDVDIEAHLGFALDAIRMIQAELQGRIPLIGFCGAPFTLACYIVEGRSAKGFIQARRFMYAEPEAWHALMERLTDLLGRYLQAQVAAGADVVQIFDSWAGILSPADFREYVLPHSRGVVEAASRSGAPVVYFGTDTSGLLEVMDEAGADVLGVDWRIDLDVAWKRFRPDTAIQGNLDPAVLFAPRPIVRERTERVLRQAAGRPGHIFNLGHGILPETPLESVDEVIRTVREFKP